MNVSADPRKPTSPAPLPPQKRKSRAGIWLILVIVVGVSLYFIFRPKSAAGDGGPGSGAASGPTGGGRGFGGPGGRGGQRGTPTVNAEPARTGDLPNFVTALGTATALNTAVVRSRVDGELIKVNFEEGQPVNQGDLLAEIDPRPFQIALQQAEGQLARDRAQLDNTRLDLQRYQNAREAVTPQQVDAAKAAVAQYEGAVKSDEGSVANYSLQLSFCHVVAPISGRTGLRQVDVGNLVRSADAAGIVVITQVQPIAVRFSVPEDSLRNINRAIATGQALPVEVLDRALKNRLAAGSLTAVDNQIDTTTGTVRIKATVPNEDLALFPNQFVNVRLLVSTEKNVTLIPTSAVQISGSERYVYVITAESTVERRTVKLGNSDGQFTAVSEGVASGDMVVTEGLDRLQNGGKVVVRTPEANPAAATAAAPPPRSPGGSSGAGGGDGHRRRKHDGAPAAKGT